MCSEVMYGAYYPYLYATSRAAPGRPFYHQYDRVSTDFKSTYYMRYLSILKSLSLLLILWIKFNTEINFTHFVPILNLLRESALPLVTCD